MYQQDIFIEQTVRRQEPKGARILAYITIGITILNVFLSIITLGIFLIPTLLFALLAWFTVLYAFAFVRFINLFRAYI